MAGPKVCFVTSELAPFAKAGGLGDVSGALPRFLHEQDCEVRLFVPLYANMQLSGRECYPVEFLQDIPLQMGPHLYSYSVFTTQLPGSSLWVYLVRCPALYGRPQLYTSDPDEYLRFAVLTRAAIESCQRMGFGPDVFHCNDWQTALGPLYLKTLYAWDGHLFGRTRSLLTIHNIGYQGVFSAGIVHDLGLGSHASLLHQHDLNAGVFNFMKTGVLHADGINTVSPTYMREVRSSALGAGLEELLSARASSFVGILNGVDYDEWSPETDRHIPHHFSAEDLSGKARNQQALLEALGLRPARGAPVLGIVSRLTGQKGFELLFDTLPWALQRHDMRVVVLGSGEARYEDFFGALQRRFPDRVCFYWGYSNPLAHLIEAGADMFLMPSRYEPCGLNQMYSLRYGTVPIVHKTGGLADTVRQFDPDTGEGTGIVFEHFNREAMTWALTTALGLYHNPALWQRMMRNGMAEDFSWEHQGAQYLKLYELLARQ